MHHQEMKAVAKAEENFLDNLDKTVYNKKRIRKTNPFFCKVK